jgi:ankyrin repeat protein
VAIRPLEVKELAEVLAVDFDDAEGIPKLKPNWRWEDEEQALLTSCSSLIAIVGTENSRVVQFAHFSVKEYLTSKRLATSSGDAPRYHIDLESAHTILAQACLSILLQADGRVEESGVGKRSPLAEYAARNWVTHAQFERVSSSLQRAMECLFDKDKPYLAAWLQLHNIDNPSTISSWSLSAHLFKVLAKFSISPLYYAALCGFEDLVKLLVVKYPQDVNASGDTYLSPLAAALARKHYQTVKLLYRNGAHVDVCGNNGETLFISTLWSGDLEKIQVLLDCKADVNIRGPDDLTPIQYVSRGTRFVFVHQNIPQLLPDLAQLLLVHGADVNARNRHGSTPLHLAAEYGRVEVMLVLLQHDANADAEDSQGRTPFHVAGSVEVVRMLLEHNANANVKDNQGETPLHVAANGRDVEVVRVLLKHGANADAEDSQGRTPLHVVSVRTGGFRRRKGLYTCCSSMVRMWMRRTTKAEPRCT